MPIEITRSPHQFRSPCHHRHLLASVGSNVTRRLGSSGRRAKCRRPDATSRCSSSSASTPGAGRRRFHPFAGRLSISTAVGSTFADRANRRRRRGGANAKFPRGYCRTVKVSPHVLRHTAANWLIQEGGDPWKVADFLAMSMTTLLKTYGHHHSEHQSDIAEGFGPRPQNVRRIR